MGLVFRETTSAVPVSKKVNVDKLTSASVKFLRSLGFKVQNVGH